MFFFQFSIGGVSQATSSRILPLLCIRASITLKSDVGSARISKIDEVKLGVDHGLEFPREHGQVLMFH